MGQCGATLAEMSGYFRVSEKQMDKTMGKAGYAETYEKGLAEFKVSLRRTQIVLAQQGNATMLIWLGKQFLGQRDKIEIASTGGDKLHEMLEIFKAGPVTPKPIEPPAAIDLVKRPEGDYGEKPLG